MSAAPPPMRGSGVLVPPAGWAARVAPWVRLCKLRIGSFVGMSAFVGGLLAGGPDVDLARLCVAATLITLTAVSASVFNQVFEQDVDARMHRTAGRPLVTGAIRPLQAVLFGTACGAVGVAGLAISFQPLSALLALGTLAAYALVYTPLKRVSSLNTAIGAIPGAMPPLLGYTAIAGAPAGWGWYLCALLFAWQFPHFLAIAWLYREDYARAGLKMLPALPNTAGVAGRQALLYSLCMLPLSILPAVEGRAGALYVVGALILGVSYCAASLGFALRENRARARRVLWVSLAYLPLLYSIVLFDPAVRLAAQLKP